MYVHFNYIKNDISWTVYLLFLKTNQTERMPVKVHVFTIDKTNYRIGSQNCCVFLMSEAIQ